MYDKIVGDAPKNRKKSLLLEVQIKKLAMLRFELTRRPNTLFHYATVVWDPAEIWLNIRRDGVLAANRGFLFGRCKLQTAGRATLAAIRPAFGRDRQGGLLQQ